MLDPDHWLWRLSSREWLDAATSELSKGKDMLKVRRTAVTHARRAAGMALNGVLVHLHEYHHYQTEDCEQMWGRSYVEHLRMLANIDAPRPFEVSMATMCRELVEITVMPSQAQLVQLQPHQHEAAAKALSFSSKIVDECAKFVDS